MPSSQSPTSSDRRLAPCRSACRRLGASPPHPPALGHLLAVDPDFEGHGSLLRGFVVHADHGDELLGRAVQIDVHFAHGVRADAVPEQLAVDLQRIIVDRSARVRLAPSLFDLGEVEAFQPDRSLRGLVAGECRLIEFGRSGGGEEASGQQGHDGERAGEAGQHGRLLGKRVLSANDTRPNRGDYSMPRCGVEKTPAFCSPGQPEDNDHLGETSLRDEWQLSDNGTKPDRSTNSNFPTTEPIPQARPTCFYLATMATRAMIQAAWRTMAAARSHFHAGSGGETPGQVRAIAIPAWRRKQADLELGFAAYY